MHFLYQQIILVQNNTHKKFVTISCPPVHISVQDSFSNLQMKPFAVIYSASLKTVTNFKLNLIELDSEDEPFRVLLSFSVLVL